MFLVVREPPFADPQAGIVRPDKHRNAGFRGRNPLHIADAFDGPEEAAERILLGDYANETAHVRVPVGMQEAREDSNDAGIGRLGDIGAPCLANRNKRLPEQGGAAQLEDVDQRANAHDAARTDRHPNRFDNLGNRGFRLASRGDGSPEQVDLARPAALVIDLVEEPSSVRLIECRIDAARNRFIGAKLLEDRVLAVLAVDDVIFAGLERTAHKAHADQFPIEFLGNGLGMARNKRLLRVRPDDFKNANRQQILSKPLKNAFIHQTPLRRLIASSVALLARFSSARALARSESARNGTDKVEMRWAPSAKTTTACM